jgi:hypothetical protein
MFESENFSLKLKLKEIFDKTDPRENIQSNEIVM